MISPALRRTGRAVALHTTVFSCAVAVRAGNICDETVPDRLHVDGIPAYSQCSDSRSSPVYSSDGVGTHTSSRGDGWVRTSWSGGYQCTEFARRYLAFRWNIDKTPGGSAGDWCDGSPPEGLVKTDAPMHGDIIVFAPRTCWAGSRGHVAVVDSADDNSVTIVEQNVVNRRTVSLSCATCFLHVESNTGDDVTAAAPPRKTPKARTGIRVTASAVHHGVVVSVNQEAGAVVSVKGFDIRGRTAGVFTQLDNHSRRFRAAPGTSRTMLVVVIRTRDATLSRRITLDPSR